MTPIKVNRMWPRFSEPEATETHLLRVWRGSLDGDGISGVAEFDARSLALAEIDGDAIRFETMLAADGAFAGTRRRFERLQLSSAVRIDPAVGGTLLRPHGAPVLARALDEGVREVYFPGAVLRVPQGLDPYVFGLFFLEDLGVWGYDLYPIINEETLGRAIMPQLPDVVPFAILL